MTRYNETTDQALLRKVKMHEFLMTGGVPIKTNLPEHHGRVVYSPPVTAITHPVCPWHGDHCPPWDEIVAGRGYWTRMEHELEGLRNDTTDNEAEDEIDGLVAALELRPRDALALRERTPKQIEAESEPKKTKKKSVGNPWDRKTEIIENLTDSRDSAIVAFGETVPDTIEIDGEEGEEGDE